ncbi:hypothetical protein WJX74_010016 [Apatococcus lobatus]|uniref:Uncharacterized protein n=1 Tax=Apatococcus lobatus TaxID=904363 RepID=A0AAW1PY34_9CHLO
MSEPRRRTRGQCMACFFCGASQRHTPSAAMWFSNLPAPLTRKQLKLLPWVLIVLWWLTVALSAPVRKSPVLPRRRVSTEFSFGAHAVSEADSFNSHPSQADNGFCAHADTAIPIVDSEEDDLSVSEELIDISLELDPMSPLADPIPSDSEPDHVCMPRQRRGRPPKANPKKPKATERVLQLGVTCAHY